MPDDGGATPSGHKMTRRLFLAAAGAAALGACTTRPSGARPSGTRPRSPSLSKGLAPTPGRAATLPHFPPYEPLPVEDFLDGKRVGARFLQSFGTYTGAADQGRALDDAAASGTDPAALRATLATITAPMSASGGSSIEIVYPQCGGLRPVALSATYMSVMSVFRQHTIDALGQPHTVTRVADVRLSLVRGSWYVDDLKSIGGSPVQAPESLSAPARALLAAHNVDLPDSAKWDIQAGREHVRLLTVLAKLADDFDFRITVLDSGHPAHVIDNRLVEPLSNHHLGYAADIWSIGGVPVCEQRDDVTSPALEFVTRALTLDPQVRIFMPPPMYPRIKADPVHKHTNLVHDDHIHVDIDTRIRVSAQPRP